MRTGGTPGGTLNGEPTVPTLYRALTGDNEVGAGVTMFAQEDRPRCRPGARDESGSGNVPQLSTSATAIAWNGRQPHGGGLGWSPPRQGMRPASLGRACLHRRPGTTYERRLRSTTGRGRLSSQGGRPLPPLSPGIERHLDSTREKIPSEAGGTSMVYANRRYFRDSGTFPTRNRE
jgi:hypothetical protein